LDDSPVAEGSPQIFNPVSIDTEVCVTHTRGGANRNNPFCTTQVKFKVVNEAKQGAPALGVKVFRRLAHDAGAWESGYLVSRGWPGFGGRHGKLKGRNLVIAVPGITGNTVRRGWAGCHAGLGDSKIRRAVTCAGGKDNTNQ